METVAEETAGVKSSPPLSGRDYDDLAGTVAQIANEDARAFGHSFLDRRIGRLAEIAIIHAFERVRRERAGEGNTLDFLHENLTALDTERLFWLYVSVLSDARAKAVRS